MLRVIALLDSCYAVRQQPLFDLLNSVRFRLFCFVPDVRAFTWVHWRMRCLIAMLLLLLLLCSAIFAPNFTLDAFLNNVILFNRYFFSVLYKNRRSSVFFKLRQLINMFNKLSAVSSSSIYQFIPQTSGKNPTDFSSFVNAKPRFEIQAFCYRACCVLCALLFANSSGVAQAKANSWHAPSELILLKVSSKTVSISLCVPTHMVW